MVTVSKEEAEKLLQLSPLATKIFVCLSLDPEGANLADIGRRIDVSFRPVRAGVEQLEDAGLVRRVPGLVDYERRFARTRKGN